MNGEMLQLRLVDALKLGRSVRSVDLCGGSNKDMVVIFDVAKMLERQGAVKVDFVDGRNVFKRGRRWRKFLKGGLKK